MSSFSLKKDRTQVAFARGPASSVSHVRPHSHSFIAVGARRSLLAVTPRHILDKNSSTINS